MLLTRADLDKSAAYHPEVAKFLTNFTPPPPPPPGQEPYEGSRTVMKAFSARTLARIGPPPTGTTETYHEIPMRDGYLSSIKIHKCSDGPPGPLVVLCFGGGFMGGDNDQLSEYARALVTLYKATVVNISYRLAPEHKFPVSQYDAWDSVEWIAENATGTLLSADPAKGFVMGGISAGGCLTATLSRKFQEVKLAHPLTGQWLCIAFTMDQETCPEKYRSQYIAMEQNAATPTLTREFMDYTKDVTGCDSTSDLCYAARSKTPISGQPRTYFQVAGMDLCRDDGLLYDEMLKEAGVPTKLDFYPGCPHGLTMLMAGHDLAKNHDLDALVGFGWLLEKEVSREDAAKALGIDMPQKA